MNTSRISLAFKALRELGPRKMGLFALYRLGLKSGYFRWKTGASKRKMDYANHRSSVSCHLLNLPEPEALRSIIGFEGLAQLKAEADEIVEGKVRLFGGEPVPLNLIPPGKLTHWTDYALGKSAFPQSASLDFPNADIKFVWEPARFGWAFILGRAYYLTGDEGYVETFWHRFEAFQDANPVNIGPNWGSAQEVAFRILAFTFAAQVFADSTHSTADRVSHLIQSIADHAARIPPTILYARAQNNNHLLSEAAGLITAAQALPDHPQAGRWSKLGWKWFHHGLETQISDDGAYMQQSTNYHRLVLHLALWVRQVTGQLLSKLAIDNLQLATHWLLNICDPVSGRVPNLGPNDGAYLLPLTVQTFADYRPVLQAASRLFLGKPAFESGEWDEMGLWLQVSGEEIQDIKDKPPDIFNTLRTSQSWAYFRVAQFQDRPGHADQLHLDLWWRGLNIARDAGTYLYNEDPPWDNSLTHTAVHNTVMVDGYEQMTLAGRFLYVDRAQGEVIDREQAKDGAWERIEATHAGYQSLGLKHSRSVTAYQGVDTWRVEDRIKTFRSDVLEAAHQVRLQWLLPDWEWKIEDSENSRICLNLSSPFGQIALCVMEDLEFSISNVQASIYRAGDLIYGSGEENPILGWVSPTYGVKQPALSLVVKVTGSLPITLISEWKFPHEEN